MARISFPSDWRKFAAIIGLASLACNGETATQDETQPPAPSPSELRATLPRLTGFDTWRKCQPPGPSASVQADCASTTIPREFVSLRVGECERVMQTEVDAVRLLAYVPHCTDAVVGRLEALSKSRDPKTLSNLAAGYFLRAHRDDQPEDLVRALDIAETAVQLAPSLPEARFNQALAEEALGFNADAVHSWETLRKGGRAWTAEAEDHWQRLTNEQSTAAAVQWPLNRQSLSFAAKTGDAVAVEQLIAPFHAAAQRHVEDEVLPGWARAISAGRRKEAEESLVLAEMIAAAIERVTGDRYLAATVQRLRDDPASEALRRGHVAFGEARTTERSFGVQQALALYTAAERDLTAGESPLRFGAMLGQATAMTFARRYDDAEGLLRTVERETRRRSYLSLAGRMHSSRGFMLMIRGRHLHALASYRKAEDVFTQIRDFENLGKVHVNKIGLFRMLGERDLTWREIMQARSAAFRMYEAQSRHSLLGESALSAAELGYGTVALRYQNAAVRLLEDALATNRDEQRTVQLRTNLGVALRARAWIRARMNDLEGARTDLDRGVALMAELSARDAAIPEGFRARIAEVRAETLVSAASSAGAIASLDEALFYASRTHYHSLTASLLIQRAEIHRRNGRPQAAMQDLRSAIVSLDAEEKAMLAEQSERNGARLWSAYLSRFQQAYRHLIRLLMDDGKAEEAFAYAERARAYEPLHRVLQHADVPKAFRDATGQGKRLQIREIVQTLPSGTFLLQYCVLDDRTYVWIVWNGGFEHRTLPVGNAAIAKWTAALQRSAAERDRDGFTRALDERHAGLFEKPLQRVSEVHAGGAVPRVVIVPDRAMHGLPFSALRKGDRHVIRDYAISVAASATLFAFSLERDRQLSLATPESVLVIADPTFQSTSHTTGALPPLRTAQSEGARIKSIYEQRIAVKPLINADATIPQFLRWAPRSAVIHIATHGFPNADVPSRSYLLLAPTDNDAGILDAEYLLEQLHLKTTRLIVLSACSSAGGTPVGPEGLAPLVRPLFSAGVAGVVGTLWNVSDTPPTEELLVRFHEYYRDGYAADDALRRAQLDLLDDPDLARNSPLAWAPFQMIGFASSPFHPPNKYARR